MSLITSQTRERERIMRFAKAIDTASPFSKEDWHNPDFWQITTDEKGRILISRYDDAEEEWKTEVECAEEIEDAIYKLYLNYAMEIDGHLLCWFDGNWDCGDLQVHIDTSLGFIAVDCYDKNGLCQGGEWYFDGDSYNHEMLNMLEYQLCNESKTYQEIVEWWVSHCI